jgi:ATP-binding cassette subfamily B (MDR/TAP) protein 1
MASESGLNGDPNILEEVSETKRDKEEEEEVKKTEKKDEEHEKTKTVPFYKLFAFADSFDFLLMILGTLGSIGNGLGFPLMTLLFGDLIDAFGENQTNTTDKVSKVALKFVWLGIGTFAAAFLRKFIGSVEGSKLCEKRFQENKECKLF